MKTTVVTDEVREFKKMVDKLERKGWITIPGSIVARFENVTVGAYESSSRGRGFFACVMEKE
jgi:hypothetical protein